MIYFSKGLTYEDIGLLGSSCLYFSDFYVGETGRWRILGLLKEMNKGKGSGNFLCLRMMVNQEDYRESSDAVTPF